MLQIKNTLGGGKPEGLYAWKKSEVGISELQNFSKSVSTLPYSFQYSSAVSHNGEIHILGSSDNSYAQNHYKWDGSSWTNVSTLPCQFNSGSVVVLNGEIHILGSYFSSYQTKHYKWDGNSWTSVSTLPYTFYYGSAVVYENEIHILGGDGSRTYHYKWDGNSWTSVSTLPYSFYQGSAVVLNGEIHILGGSSAAFKHYKWDGSSWTEVSTLPYSFYWSSAVVFENEIHILGSNGSSYRQSHYKWDGNSWTSVSTLPYSFYQGSAVVFDNGIYVIGGSGGPTKHYLIIGRVPVYTFLDYIVSDKENAYPDGGEKDGYYYEKVGGGLTPELFGCTKMAVDTFTPASDTKGTNKYISHSLGEIPKIISVSCDESSLDNLGIYSVLALNMTKATSLNYGTCFFNNYGTTYESSSSLQDISSLRFRVHGTILWKANVKYTVVTMA